MPRQEIDGVKVPGTEPEREPPDPLFEEFRPKNELGEPMTVNEEEIEDLVHFRVEHKPGSLQPDGRTYKDKGQPPKQQGGDGRGAPSNGQGSTRWSDLGL